MPTTTTKHKTRFNNSARRAEATVNKQLRNWFEDDFMKNASLAERQFLSEVFGEWFSRWDRDSDTLGIATAFEEIISHKDVYFIDSEEWRNMNVELHQLRTFRKKFAIMDPPERRTA